jgi:hypothetical protein
MAWAYGAPTARRGLVHAVEAGEEVDGGAHLTTLSGFSRSAFIALSAM